MEFPKCKAQEQFEDLAKELIKIIATFSDEQQTAVFEYAQAIKLENNKNNRRVKQ